MATPEEPAQDPTFPKAKPSAAVTAAPSGTVPSGVTAAPANTGVGPRIAKALIDFWQLGTAIAGITAAVITGLTYFATHQEVNRVACFANQNLLLRTMPAEIERVKMQVELKKDQARALPDGPAERMIEKDIDQLEGNIAKLEEKEQKNTEAMERHACDSEITSKTESK